VVVLIIAAGLGYQFLNRPHPRPVPDGLVTTFRAGEFRTVPQACSAVTPATLNQYLPGTRRVVTPRPLYGSLQSLCNWTVDHPPLYLVLEVTVQAYAPSALATGNGSATQAAIDAYQQASQQLASPPRNTHLPRAAITTLTGYGNAAFAALQVPLAAGDPTNLLTVVVRDHNVMIKVVAQGPARSHGRYTAVPAAQLRVAADAAARDILARLR
jgi:hypothetical protein